MCVFIEKVRARDENYIYGARQVRIEFLFVVTRPLKAYFAFLPLLALPSRGRQLGELCFHHQRTSPSVLVVCILPRQSLGPVSVARSWPSLFILSFPKISCTASFKSMQQTRHTFNA